MKKMLGKRFVFLVALLVSFCMPTMALNESKDTNYSSSSIGPTTIGSFKYTMAKGNGTQDPARGSEGSFMSKKYYLRLYSGNTLTIEPQSDSNPYVISGVTLTLYSNFQGDVTVESWKGTSKKATQTKTISSNTMTVTVSAEDIADIADKVVIYATAEMKVTKIQVNYKHVSTISFTPDNYTLQVGGTGQTITPTRNGSQTVTYSIDNTNVATVTKSTYNNSRQSATVTPVASGTATITATIEGGEDYTAASATINITVSKIDPTISVSGITELIAGRTTQLSVTTTSDGEEITYVSDNTSVLTVSETGMVTAVAAGEATVKATVAATNKYNAKSASITIKVAAKPSQDVLDLLKIKGVKPTADGTTKYYLMNVGTGLKMAYGGEWGTHCVETQNPHEVILEDNGDGSVAIAGMLGYLESKSLWFDFPKVCPSKDSEGYESKFDPWTAGAHVSKWRLREVQGYEGQYHLVGDDERVLSSVGNKSGLLVLKSDEDKALQRWIFVTGEYFRNNIMSQASAELPVDVSFAFRGGAFDLADDFEVVGTTPEAFKTMMPYLASEWNKYSSYDTNVWWRVVRSWNPDEYNCCNILENLAKDDVVTYDVKLPAGAYRFTLEGFYRHQNSNVNIEAKVIVYDKNKEVNLKTIVLDKNSSEKNSGVSFGNKDVDGQSVPITGYEYGVNTTPASIFRDNDNYLKEVTFYLDEESELEIRIDREGFTGSSDNLQLICLDNFNLYYTGYYSIDGVPLVKEPKAWIDELAWNADYLYVWDVEKQEYVVYVNVLWTGGPFGYDYDSYLDLVNKHGLPRVSEDEIIYVDSRDEINEIFDNAKDAYDDYKGLTSEKNPEIQEYLDAADDNLIYKNYINANINEYFESLTDEGKAVFNEKLTELGVDPYSIDSRLEYYEAIANMELAYEYGKLESAKQTGGRGLIFNPTFSLGVYKAGFKWNEQLGKEDVNSPYYSPLGWNVGYSAETVVGTITQDGKKFATEYADGEYIFNTWWQGIPLTQKVTEIQQPGVYILSALIASGDPGNDATIYLTAKDGSGTLYKRGVNPPSGGKSFGDYSKKCIVGNDGELTVGIVGGNDDDHTENNPGPIGTYNENGHWWYKCDNFRLEYLPNGRLPLRDEDTKIKNLIDPFVGVDVTRSISTGNWSTLVLPFDMPCPDNWDVETLNVVDQYDGDVRLTFSAIDKSAGLKAGVPYIVKVGSAVTSISAENVSVNTTLLVPGVASTTEQYDVEFVPVYTSGYVPASELEKNEDGTLKKDDNGDYIPTGAQYYFLRGGKLKRCVYDEESGKGNKIKGFRAYFKVTPKTAEARMALRSLSMRTSEETDIENVAEEEVTVIGIYDVNGIRLSEMKSGINILRMNNGTTKKVMVK